MRDLIASGQRVLPRIEPDGHAACDDAGDTERVAAGEAGDERREAAQHEHDTPSRDAVQSQEHARQHQGGAEILLQEEEEEQSADADRQRSHVLPPRELQVTADVTGRTDAFGELAQE